MVVLIVRFLLLNQILFKATGDGALGRSMSILNRFANALVIIPRIVKATLFTGRRVSQLLHYRDVKSGADVIKLFR